MIYTREQKRAAYKKLPPEVQDLVMSNEMTELIENKLKELGLDENLSNLADSEILYAMLGLQTLDNAIKNISDLSKKNIQDLSNLKIDLQNQIFNKFEQKNVAKSKEEAIVITPETKEAALKDLDKRVEQQKAAVPETHPENLPMVEKGEVAHAVPHMEIKNNEVKKEEKPPMPPPTVHYPGGKDPYREPLN